MHVPSAVKNALAQETANTPTDKIIEYEPCPLCGSLAAVDQRAPQKGEKAGHVPIPPRASTQLCANCGTIAQRYPEIAAWVRRCIANHNLWCHVGPVEAEEAEAEEAEEDDAFGRRPKQWQRPEKQGETKCGSTSKS